jgi:broad specificity phosphatase PhoE
VKIELEKPELPDGRVKRCPTVRLFVLARHAESFANVSGIMSSDPRRPLKLTPRGRDQARHLGAQLANLEIDLAVCSRLLRTQQTVELALQGRPTPVVIDDGFDEVRAGDFDERPIESYWSWEQEHSHLERLPHGESLVDALFRYATALRRLLMRTEPVTLIVIHQLALHHIALGASTTRVPVASSSFANAVPYLFDEQAIQRSVTYIENSIRSERRASRSYRSCSVVGTDDLAQMMCVPNHPDRLADDWMNGPGHDLFNSFSISPRT